MTDEKLKASADAIVRSCAVAHAWFSKTQGRSVSPQKAAGELWDMFAIAIDEAERRGRVAMREEAARFVDDECAALETVAAIRALPADPPLTTPAAAALGMAMDDLLMALLRACLDAQADGVPLPERVDAATLAAEALTTPPGQTE